MLFSPDTCVSLPLMGIRNSNDASSPRPARNLTTPHGDQEPNYPDENGKLYMLSLPLMGIRNAIPIPEGRVFTQLTTPHGDQEQSRLLDSNGSFSISLPLMGIRNCSHRTITTICPGISLPLMGIRNTAGPACRATTPTAHYPSWGSGTCARFGRRLSTAPSLPLMGIRNNLPEERVVRVVQLTTPHGDQERRFMIGSTPGETMAHYPSWGSGTKPGGLSARPDVGLTTPHGDQERTKPGRGSVMRPTSLPLMGIRNETLIDLMERWRTSSLPLMGIRNLLD